MRKAENIKSEKNSKLVKTGKKSFRWQTRKPLLVNIETHIQTHTCSHASNHTGRKRKHIHTDSTSTTTTFHAYGSFQESGWEIPLLQRRYEYSAWRICVVKLFLLFSFSLWKSIPNSFRLTMFFISQAPVSGKTRWAKNNTNLTTKKH